MDFAVERKALLAGINIAARAIKPRAPLPVLGNILFEADADENELHLYATDYELSISHTIEADVIEGGSMTFPAKTIRELLNTYSDDEVTIKVIKDRAAAMLRCGGYKSRLHGIPANEFPPVELGEEADFTIPGGAWREMLGHTIFAVAGKDDIIRPYLQGVCLSASGGAVRLLGADGYRFSIRHGQAKFEDGEEIEQTCIIPARAAEQMRMITPQNADIGIAFPRVRDGFTAFMPNTIISSATIHGDFPAFREGVDFNNVLSTLSVDKTDMLMSLKNIEVFCRDNADKGQVTISDSITTDEDTLATITLKGMSGERGNSEAVLYGQIEGGAVDTYCNIKFLQDALHSIKEDRVVIQFTTNTLTLKPEGRDDFMHILMLMSE